jgi:ferritin
MISKAMQEALNKQVNRELYSAYLYLSMSAYFESENLKGFAKWLTVQAKEELGHAMKIYEYIIQTGARAKMMPVEAPKSEWRSALEAFENVAAHEKAVTGMINDLVDLAIKEKDHATNNMLQWFVKEQVEEEANANEIVEKIKAVGGDRPGPLFMIDHNLGKRE